MPPILPKRCPNCAARCVKTGTDLAYWLCPTCGWTDDPAVLQPAQEAAAETAVVTEALPEPGA